MLFTQRASIVSCITISACTAFSNVDVPSDGGKTDGSAGNPGGTVNSGGSANTGNSGNSGAGTGGTPVGGSGGSAPACTDCGTSECECSPAAPTGWTHVRIVETLDGSVPACPPGYDPSAVIIGEGAVDTGCGACTCGAFDAASAGSCNEIWQWSGVCNGPPNARSPMTAGQCVQLSAAFVKIGMTGTCPASAPPNAPAFSKKATLCEPASFGSGCDKDACIALPKPPFESLRCVVSQIDGDLACPSEFPVKRNYNVSFTDSRVCTGCSCNLTDVSCSGGTAKWCSDGSCSNCPYSSVIPGNCTSTDGYFFEVFSGSANPTGGSCTASGTAISTGNVTAGGVRVVCCV